jgi:ferredoxin
VAKGEIVIDEMLCQACGFCVEFCNQECITIPVNRLGPRVLSAGEMLRLWHLWMDVP